jgi:hypothetical protein
MTDVNKDLSVQIMEALKPILPKGVGFIMICGSVAEADLGITSNMPDELALAFLRDAISTIETEPAISIEKEVN